jgi:phage tail sheath gpL-like
MPGLAFANIPGNLRIPGFFAELNAAKANTATQPQRTLIIGQILAGGLAAPNVPQISAGASDAKVQGGQGSMLAAMTAAYLQNDPFQEVWYLPLADAGGGAAGTGTIAFTGPSSAAGTISLYVGGNLSYYGQPGAISVPVTSGQSATSIGAAVAAAINAVPDLPVTATASTGTVTLSARHKGLAGNDIDIRLNYQGSAGGEVLPAGVAAVITAISGGSTNPTLTTALGNLANLGFDFIVSPFTDNTSVAALTAFMNDTAGRWSWQTQTYGHVFIASRGTFGSQTTFGTALNDQHLSVMGFFDSPTPNYVWAAALAGAAAASLRADPGLPLQTLALQGVLAPPVQSRFTPSLRNTLLYDGISTYTVDAAGAVHIENCITTYQLNSTGQPDNSYLEIETLFLLMYVLRDLRSFLTSNYGRSKLAADGTRAASGSGVVTPSILKAAIVGEYRRLESLGEVQNSAAFAAGLIVQISANNPSRVDILFDPTLIGQLRIFAVLAQFRLQ